MRGKEKHTKEMGANAVAQGCSYIVVNIMLLG